MNCITIKRGNDGFGSQLFSIISGIAFCIKNGIQYSHTRLENIKLVDNNQFQNTEIDLANEMIDKIIDNLGVDTKQPCNQFPFFYNQIYNEGVEVYFNDEFLKKISDSYPNQKPETYNNNKFNIAIHVRRGDDIPQNSNSELGEAYIDNLNARWIKPEVYEDLIDVLINKIPNTHIHIFSWKDSGIKLNYDNITYHVTDTGDSFLGHFNHLVSADLLVVGSSTFSISAGFFNRNKTICHDSLCKLQNTPIPIQWIKNYDEIINNGNSIN
jgi:hypothetical protein